MGFHADLNIKDFGFPDDARIYIEPYFKSSYMRFDFGAVDKISSPMVTYLTDLPETDFLLFRVKIVDSSKKNGKLLGLADRIKPLSEETEVPGKQSILPVDFQQDLGQQIYRLVFDEERNQVILEINRRLENGPELLRTNEFKALVLPGIVRLITERLRIHEFDDESDSWQDQWLNFYYSKLNVEDKPDFETNNEDAMDDWIDNVVASFCRKFNIFRNYSEINFN